MCCFPLSNAPKVLGGGTVGVPAPEIYKGWGSYSGNVNPFRTGEAAHHPDTGLLVYAQNYNINGLTNNLLGVQ